MNILSKQADITSSKEQHSPKVYFDWEESWEKESYDGENTHEAGHPGMVVHQSSQPVQLRVQP